MIRNAQLKVAITNLCLSVVWMMNWVRIEALELFWRKQNDSLVAADLCVEILLLIVVTRGHVTCAPVNSIHGAQNCTQPAPLTQQSLDEAAIHVCFHTLYCCRIRTKVGKASPTIMTEEIWLVA